MGAIILLFLFAIGFGYEFSNYIIQKKARRWHHIGIKKGYHIHHSMYGIASFLLVPITISNVGETAVIVGFGLGIIIEHTLHEGFIFINKVQKDLEKTAMSISYAQEE